MLAGMAGGACLATLWPAKITYPQSKEEVFVIEEEVPLVESEVTPPPPPEPTPPPPDPDPPPPEPEIVEEEPLPTPQFGLEEEALSETGDLAVTTGNTIMKEADSVVKPTPPPLPPVPEYMDQPPKILKGNSPEYPERALDYGIEGTVVALITIDTTGRVIKAKIEKSGGRDFDRAVLESARSTVFQPPMRQGRRIKARFRRPYEFRLE